MTKQEMLQRICETALGALRDDYAFNEVCAGMEAVGLEHRVVINIEVFSREAESAPPLAADPRTADANFLRSLRIQPDLEIR